MKATIIFFSLAFMSCVTTANGGVANINSKQEPAVQSAADLQSDSNKAAGLFDYLKGVLSEDPEKTAEAMEGYIQLAGYDECVQACVAAGYDEDGCRGACACGPDGVGPGGC